jgi:hypothetical protein
VDDFLLATENRPKLALWCGWSSIDTATRTDVEISSADLSMTILAIPINQIGNRFVGGPPVINPDAALFDKTNLGPDRPQPDAILIAFQLEGISRRQPQAIAKILWDYNPSRFVQAKLLGHDAIFEWQNPSVNAIMGDRRSS